MVNLAGQLYEAAAGYLMYHLAKYIGSAKTFGVRSTEKSAGVRSTEKSVILKHKHESRRS